MTRLIPFAAIALFACIARRPPPSPPASPTATSSRRMCHLPPLGVLEPAVGFPTADAIYISRSDWSALRRRWDELRAWADAVVMCLEGP